jgi:hypothetical protein
MWKTGLFCGLCSAFRRLFAVLVGDCAAKWMFYLDVGCKCVIFAGSCVYGKMAKKRKACV